MAISACFLIHTIRENNKIQKNENCLFTEMLKYIKHFYE